MLHGQAMRKAPGGKLLRVDVDYSEQVERVRLTGDFFLFPEDAVEALEAGLAGFPLGSAVSQFVDKIQSVLAQTQAELYGISPTDIAETLLEALKCPSA
jgi:lipoate-protein ligase A